MGNENGRDEMSRRAILAGTAAGMVSTGAWAAASPEPEAYLSLREIARRIAAREVSPVDVTQRMLARIAKADPVLKSYATVMGDQAMADARAAAIAWSPITVA